MGSSADEQRTVERPLREVFGFDLDDRDWLDRLRASKRPDELRRDRIGEYELTGLIGRGGQGVVYRARQPRTGREIALKRLSAGAFASVEMQARFAREVAAAASLDHPNIVTVYGSEVVEGLPVLTMQWIDGAPFDCWAKGRHAAAQAADEIGAGARESLPSVISVLRAFGKVCDAVHHAHQRGIIHRDLKPSNILVDGDDQPHVLDFGLAKFASQADESLTMSGHFLGTPAYAAPEQLSGDQAAVDVRTDVYALGAVLFQAVTGRPMFDGRENLPELFEAIQHEDPRPPSALRPHISREIDAIILKAVRKEKALRYGSVEALGADIQRYLDGDPVSAHPPTVAYRIRKFLRRHAAMSALGGAALLCVLALTALSVVQAARANAARGESLREAQLQRDTSRVLLGVVQSIAQRSTAARRTVSIQALGESIDKQLKAQTLRADPEVSIELHRHVAAIMKAASAIDLALEHDSAALRQALDVYGPDHSTVCAIRMALADNLARLGRHDMAEAEARAAVEIARTVAGPVSVQACDALVALGQTLGHAGRFADAEPSLLEAIQISEHLGGDIGAHERMADYYIRLGRLDEANDVLRRALLILEPHGATQGARPDRIRHHMGHVLYRQSDYEGAESLFGQVAANRMRIKGLQYRYTALGMAWHGRALHALGRYAEAADRFEKALVWFEHLTEKSTNAAELRFGLAATMLADGREDEGRRQLLRAASRAEVAEPGNSRWDAVASSLETALRDNSFRVDAALRDRLGEFGWLARSDVDGGIGESNTALPDSSAAASPEGEGD